MSRLLTSRALSESVLKGIENAWNNWHEMTGDSWLWEAPEYFVTGSIGARIFKDAPSGHFVWLEAPFKILHKEARLRRRWPGSSSSKRADISVHTADSLPLAVVEVKSPVAAFAELKRDLDRVSDFLRVAENFRAFRFGVVAFYSDSSVPKSKYPSAEARLQARLSYIQKQANIWAKKHKKLRVTTLGITRTKVVDQEKHAWLAGCVLLER